MSGPPSQAPVASDWTIENPSRRLRAGGAGAHRQRIVEVHHGEVVRRLRGEDARLGRRVAVEAVVAIEVIGRDVEQDGDARVERLHRLQLEARHLDDAEAARPSAAGVPTASASGSPRLPPTNVGRPVARSISPTSVVVVDLPLVPVMATIVAGDEAARPAPARR